MPNVMAALLNIGGALCSTPQSLADAHYWNAVQQCCQNRTVQVLDLRTLHLAKFRYEARTPENVYMVYQPRRWPNIVQSLVGLR